MSETIANPTLALLVHRLALTLGLVVGAFGPAGAAVTITAKEVGGDVVVESVGALDVSQAVLTNSSSNNISGLNANLGTLNFSDLNAAVDIYSISGPSSFGIGQAQFNQSSSASGVQWRLTAVSGQVYLPDNYANLGNKNLVSSITFAGKSFANLGMKTGTYTWNLLGSGDKVLDTITLTIGEVPLPGALPLLASALGGLWLQRRRQRTLT